MGHGLCSVLSIWSSRDSLLQRTRTESANQSQLLMLAWERRRGESQEACRRETENVAEMEREEGRMIDIYNSFRAAMRRGLPILGGTLRAGVTKLDDGGCY